ncbi:MAG: hypothetical protein ACOCZK_03505 [Planctomycetota bacterium]
MRCTALLLPLLLLIVGCSRPADPASAATRDDLATVVRLPHAAWRPVSLLNYIKQAATTTIEVREPFSNDTTLTLTAGRSYTLAHLLGVLCRHVDRNYRIAGHRVILE